MSQSSETPRQPTILASFRTKEELEAALSYLEGEAISRSQISVRQADAPSEPSTHTGSEPLREDEHRNLRTMRTSMAAAAVGMAAAGVVVATGGAALPAVGAAVAAGAGAGGLSEVAAQATGTESTAASEHGQAIVVVKPANVDQTERARGILRKTSAIKVWEEAVS